MVDDIDRIAAAQISVPAGHCLHATAWNGLVFTSGQLGARGDGSHTCESAWGSDAERHTKSLRSLIWRGIPSRRFTAPRL
jgi:2-iminobutanoate/2-iminopropanoate deaminase